MKGLRVYDYAFIKLRGTPPAGIGLDLNVAGDHIDQVGYPANYYNASRMVDEFTNKDGNNPSHIASPMGPGSSGGGWVHSVSSGATTQYSVTAVTSFKYNDDPNSSYGPVMTQTTLDVYDFAARGCVNKVQPAGAPFVVSTNNTEPEADTVMGPISEDLQNDVTIEEVNDPACPCESKQRATLVNSSSSDYLVGIRRISTGPNGVETSVDYDKLPPGQRKKMMCLKETSGSKCDVDNVIRISYAHIASAGNINVPRLIPNTTMAMNLIGRDLAQCEADCAAPQPNKICLDLGRGAIPALAPLGKFVEKIDGGGSGPDGILISKDAIITEYGGNPTNTKDPCLRSEISKSGTTVQNLGLACGLATKTLFPQSDLKTRLRMPPGVKGNPTAWSPSLTALTNGSPATLFPDRLTGMKIDFGGPSSDVPTLNKLYSVDIYAVKRLSAKQILLSTTRGGCLHGYYK